MVDEAVLNAAPENELIRNTMKKAESGCEEREENDGDK